MSTPSTIGLGSASSKHTPYVPESMEMKEFTLRALVIGLIMTAILGSANAYLGLKAGMTIAATYPAAVIGMALLRLMKGSLLEENIARTVGSIGESVAAGAVFTIPAFILAGLWPGLSRDKYWTSVALMVIGGTLGILFVTLLRRVMVEDADLPFPESVAASQIHKAGQQGSRAAKLLFANMGFGGLTYLLGAVNVFSASNSFPISISALGKKLLLRTSTNPNVATTLTGGATLLTAPDVSPAYLGVGYIIECYVLFFGSVRLASRPAARPLGAHGRETGADRPAAQSHPQSAPGRTPREPAPVASRFRRRPSHPAALHLARLPAVHHLPEGELTAGSQIDPPAWTVLQMEQRIWCQ